MNSQLLLVALSWVFGASCLCAKSELETLRSLCAEQERQIRQLEDDNAKLRSLNTLATTRSADKPAAALPAATVAAAAPAGPLSSAKAARTYPVKDGETFTSISKKFGIPIATLTAANPEVKPTAMRPGQVIRLALPAQAPAVAGSNSAAADKPAAHPATPAMKTPTAAGNIPPTAKKAASPPAPPAKPIAASAPAPAAVPQKTTDSPPAKTALRLVAITGNTTYGEFAAKHGTTVSRLNEINALDLVASAAVAKGSELNVPVQP